MFLFCKSKFSLLASRRVQYMKGPRAPFKTGSDFSENRRYSQILITDRISLFRDQTMDSNSDNIQDLPPQRSDYGLKL